MDLVHPYLEQFPEPGGPAQRIPVDPLPFRIGRSPTSHLVVYSRHVSFEHAEIQRADDAFVIRDLNSTNGTFVNGKRVQNAFIAHGDIVHIAHTECKFVVEPAAPAGPDDQPATVPTRGAVPTSQIRANSLLRDLLEQDTVRSLYQPIVQLKDRRVVGFEALGRGTHEDLNGSPAYLFGLAAACGLAGSLSQKFRQAAASQATFLPPNTQLFFNLHPAEIGDPTLIDRLAAFQETLPPGHPVVMEVHEDAVAELATLRHLRDQLVSLGMALAYDDFGAGQSRLMELAEVPPGFIKLDMRLIRDLHLMPSRQELVQALNSAAKNLGVRVIAEGIEKEEEAAICLKLGCQLGQGYLFGRPQGACALGRTPKDTHVLDLSQVRQRLRAMPCRK